MSVSEAAKRLRESASGRDVAIWFGYSTGGEMADWLEASADDSLAQAVAPKILARLARAERQ